MISPAPNLVVLRPAKSSRGVKVPKALGDVALAGLVLTIA
jgi:hypothetical protein